MSNATEDLKLLYISNLNTIKELNSRVEQLESEKNIQEVSYLNEVKELNDRFGQIKSEKADHIYQLATGLIEVVDTFEKLTKAVSKKALNKTAKGKKVFVRFKKARKSLKELVVEFGITKITFPENQLIDGFYKVVGTEPDADKREDTILSVVKNGYIRGNELIRKAEVIVVKNHAVSGDD